jgi:hypothetical protein
MCSSSCPLIVTSMAINHRRLMTAVKRSLRIAGALYLLGVVLGGVAQLAARAGIRLPGAATSAGQHMDAQPATFQVSPVADIAMAALFVTVGIALYLGFRHIDRHAAGTTVIYVAVGVGMILVNLLFQFAALLGEADPFHHALGARTSGGLVARLLNMHDHGYTITGAFFGLWLLALGYLAYQSSQIPPVLNTLLTISWILDALLGLLWPDLPAVIHTIIAPPSFADLWLILYMVTKGVPRRSKPAARPRRGPDDGQRRGPRSPGFAPLTSSRHWPHVHQRWGARSSQQDGRTVTPTWPISQVRSDRKTDAPPGGVASPWTPTRRPTHEGDSR